MTDAFTNRELEQCAMREVGHRRRVYERLVADGRMRQAKADREIAMMETIAARLKAEADAEDAKGRLL